MLENPEPYPLSTYREGLMVQPPLAALRHTLNNTCEFGRQEVWSYLKVMESWDAY